MEVDQIPICNYTKAGEVPYVRMGCIILSSGHTYL